MTSSLLKSVGAMAYRHDAANASAPTTESGCASAMDGNRVRHLVLRSAAHTAVTNYPAQTSVGADGVHLARTSASRSTPLRIGSMSIVFDVRLAPATLRSIGSVIASATSATNASVRAQRSNVSTGSRGMNSKRSWKVKAVAVRSVAMDRRFWITEPVQFSASPSTMTTQRGGCGAFSAMGATKASGASGMTLNAYVGRWLISHAEAAYAAA